MSSESKSTLSLEKWKSHKVTQDNADYYFFQAAAEAKTGIVVVQDGLSDQMLERAQDFQSHGISAFVPNVSANSEDFSKRVVQGANFLKSKGIAKVYIAGYRAGASSTVTASISHADDFQGAIVFNNISSKSIADISNFKGDKKIPLIFHFGRDEDSKAQKELENALKSHKWTYALHHYSQDSSFAHDSKSEDYKLSLILTVNFMKDPSQYVKELNRFDKLKWASLEVSLSSSNSLGDCPGYYFPAKDDFKSDLKPGLIVIQEWWGVNNQMMLRATEFQNRGIDVVVPDLYRGKLAEEVREANHLMSGLDWPGAIKDLTACSQFLKQKGAKKVFVTGYCMGGALSLAAGVLLPDHIDGAIPYYGIPGSSLADPSKSKAPVQCHFGTADNIAGFSDKAAQDNLEAALIAGKVPHEFYRYEGLGHAFANPFRKEVYNEEAATKAFNRTLEFIKKYSTSKSV